MLQSTADNMDAQPPGMRGAMLAIDAAESAKRKKKRSAESAERNRVMAKQNRERKKRELHDLEHRMASLDGVYSCDCVFCTVRWLGIAWGSVLSGTGTLLRIFQCWLRAWG